MRYTLFAVPLVAVLASAQTKPAAPEPTFAVVSVKPNRTGEPGGSFVMSPGRFLESTRGPVELMVIDSAERPAEN
jgi:hypothetical protein